MDREHLILTGFFMFFSMQAIVSVGYFRFYTKGYEFVTVHGNSMLPTLENGQKAIVNYNIPEGNLTNMIVVFGDASICHRCVKDDGQWLTFKGDNSSSFEHVTRDELKAIFVKVALDPFIDSITLGLQ
jgi:signal peptidase I